jgi:hypothetical protein
MEGAARPPHSIPNTMPVALAFNPIFVYVAVAISGILALSRLLLGWAMRE